MTNPMQKAGLRPPPGAAAPTTPIFRQPLRASTLFPNGFFAVPIIDHPPCGWPISVNFPQGAKTLPTEEIISQCSYIEKIITIFDSAHVSLE